VNPQLSFKAAFLCAAILLACSWNALSASGPVTVEGRNIRLEFDDRMHSHVIARFDGKEIVLGPFAASETVTLNGTEVADFALSGNRQQGVRGPLGAGNQTTLTGTAGAVLKTVVVTVYDRFPQMAFFQVRYTNKGNENMRVTGWSNNRYSISARQGDAAPAFWSYEAGSYERRPDWVVPLKVNFKQENYLGMNATDYGGGTPVADVWRRDAGLAVGHTEMTAKLVSLPVEMPDADHATLGLSFKPNQIVKPGDSLETFRSFAAVHQGDHFQTLRAYSQVMQAQGVKFQPAPASAFEPIWCAWGYGRTFTPTQVLSALPVVKKLGFSWVGVDDGWQSSDGDWGLVKTKFPNGDADMRALVDQIHGQGFRA